MDRVLSIAIFSLSILVFAAGSYGQVTVKDTVQLTDPSILADELKRLITLHAKPGMTSGQIHEALKGKPLGQGQTVESYFAVKPKLARYVAGLDKHRDGVVFRGHAFRLIPEDEFPEPLPGPYGMGTGSGGGRRSVASREELIQPFPSHSVTAVWQDSSIRLSSKASRSEPGVPEAVSGRFDLQDNRQSVMSPQMHFELGFVRDQQIPLIYVEDNVFSLDTYDFFSLSGPGFIVWLPDETPGENRQNIEVVLVIRLIPPFVREDKVSKDDRSAKRPHVASRVRIFAEIAGIWLRDSKSGEVIAKGHAGSNQGVPIVAPAAKPQLPRNREFQIISKPKAEYTSAARTNGVNGSVKLRVTFLPNGEVGKVAVIKGLPDGLTQQAVNAAKLIKFEPAIRNGVAVSITRDIEYNFYSY